MSRVCNKNDNPITTMYFAILFKEDKINHCIGNINYYIIQLHTKG